MPRYFLVFQGDTYDEEKQLSCLWAPKKNKSGNEVWTYDKVGSSQSSSSGVSATYGQAQLNQGFWAFLFGGTTNSAQSNSDSSTESKSLTVIITFDSDSTVSDFTYQSLKY